MGTNMCSRTLSYVLLPVYIVHDHGEAPAMPPPSASSEPTSVMDHNDVPQDGDTILVLRREWLELILSLLKTMEVRGCKMKAKQYWLGCGGVIYGRARTSTPVEITSQHQWAELRPLHRVDGNMSKYKKTFGLPLEEISRISEVRYRHPKGAIGTVIYHPIAEALPHEAMPQAKPEPNADHCTGDSGAAAASNPLRQWAEQNVEACDHKDAVEQHVVKEKVALHLGLTVRHPSLITKMRGAGFIVGFHKKRNERLCCKFNFTERTAYVKLRRE